MKMLNKITEALGLYDEEEILEEEYEQEQKKEPEKEKKKGSLFAKKSLTETFSSKNKVEEKATIEEAPKKATMENTSGKTIAMPLADKQVKVVVLEPEDFINDSKKIADYLRNKQPVVVNFDNTDGIITKRMTDFISGTIYALGGSMKKIGKSILVCAPKNVDIDAGVNIYDEKGRQPWEEK